MTLWQPAYIGLGSNLNDPVQQVQSAFRALAVLPSSRLVATSQLVRSRPLGNRDQPDYVNAVAALLTQLQPVALLAALHGIEDAHGRERTDDRWSSRTLDLDILAIADLAMDDGSLTLPHPHLHTRDFALGPLNEVAPDLELPGLGRVADLARAVDLSELEPL